jgi:hypothetical protein
MLRRCAMAMLGAAVLLSPAAANAEADSASSRYELAQLIREAGYDCRQVESVDVPTNAPSGWESFSPDIVHCSDGKNFLVVRTGRAGNTAKPLVRPLF